MPAFVVAQSVLESVELTVEEGRLVAWYPHGHRLSVLLPDTRPRGRVLRSNMENQLIESQLKLQLQS